MRALTGIGVGVGAVLGPVLRMPDPLPEPAEGAPAGQAPAESSAAAETALRAVAARLGERAAAVEGTAREVLEAQAMMAADPALITDIRARIEAGRSAERAVHEAFAAFRELLAAAGGYLGERAADLKDVGQRVIAELLGVPAPEVPVSTTPFVLVAQDLAPADTAQLDLDTVLAIVTAEGSATSHTAILARERGLPAVVGVAGAATLRDGQEVAVEAALGRITPDPDEALRERIRIAQADRAAAEQTSGPGALADGSPVPLLSNLGEPGGIDRALAAGAEGIGLFRTEFLYLEHEQAPERAVQREAYRTLLDAFPGRKVVVRCLDAGADKPLPFLHMGQEENPALGRRGLRALRAEEGILREQLAALAEAAEGSAAELWVMAPMVADAEETAYFCELARAAGLGTVGVMAEVPSLAMVAEQVLEHADFISIGTNDLTQYAMAADRLLGTVAAYQDAWHPAVLRLIERIAAAGVRAGKPVGVCGEAAADPLLAVLLVGLGVTSLSMTPAAITDVRAELARHSRPQAEALAAAALTATSAAAARTAVARLIEERK